MAQKSKKTGLQFNLESRSETPKARRYPLSTLERYGAERGSESLERAAAVHRQATRRQCIKDAGPHW